MAVLWRHWGHLEPSPVVTKRSCPSRHRSRTAGTRITSAAAVALADGSSPRSSSWRRWYTVRWQELPSPTRLTTVYSPHPLEFAQLIPGIAYLGAHITVSQVSGNQTLPIGLLKHCWKRFCLDDSDRTALRLLLLTEPYINSLTTILICTCKPDCLPIANVRIPRILCGYYG